MKSEGCKIESQIGLIIYNFVGEMTHKEYVKVFCDKCYLERWILIYIFLTLYVLYGNFMGPPDLYSDLYA